MQCVFFTTGDNWFLFAIVKATFTQIPVNTSALVGTTAQFNCTADGVTRLTYLVNSMIAEVSSFGVTLSPPVYSGSETSVNLYVPVTRSMKNWPVVCVAYLLDETSEVSPAAYLQGLCQCIVHYCFSCGTSDWNLNVLTVHIGEVFGEGRGNDSHACHCIMQTPFLLTWHTVPECAFKICL